MNPRSEDFKRVKFPVNNRNARQLEGSRRVEYDCYDQKSFAAKLELVKYVKKHTGVSKLTSEQKRCLHRPSIPSEFDRPVSPGRSSNRTLQALDRRLKRKKPKKRLKESSTEYECDLLRPSAASQEAVRRLKTESSPDE